MGGGLGMDPAPGPEFVVAAAVFEKKIKPETVSNLSWSWSKRLSGVVRALGCPAVMSQWVAGHTDDGCRPIVGRRFLKSLPTLNLIQ